MSKVDFLKHVPIFNRLSERDLEALAANLQRKFFGRGEIIFHQGSPGYCLYIIESGAVRIYTLSESGQEISIIIFGPGDVIGELAILDNLPRSASAITMAPTRTYILYQDDFFNCVRLYPEIALNIMAALSAKIRYTTEYAESLAFMDVCGRVARKLLELSDQYGEINVRLTQTELASLVGSSREWVNKVLAAFRDRGLIEVKSGKIKILDPEGLGKQISFH